MKKITLLMMSAWLALPVAAVGQDDQQGDAGQPETLQQLLEQVEQAAGREARIDQQRLQEFRQQRAQQQRLLEEARAELRAQEQRSDRLNNEFDANERELAELSTTLNERMGNLGELFGVVRQIAGDMRSTINDSLVSAQFPGRAEFYANLAERKDTELPSIEELRRMWTGMVRQIAESGNVVEFTADLVNADGDLVEDREVVRVGVFNAVSNGKFLQWDSSQNMLLELPRQPAGRYQDMAEELQQAEPGTVQEMAVDFTRGNILSQVVRAPTLRERVRQGGPVGMVIIAIGVLGVLLRRNAIVVFMSVELMLNAVNLTLVAFSQSMGDAAGQVLVFFVMSVAAAEAAIGLAIVIALFRKKVTVDITEFNLFKY